MNSRTAIIVLGAAISLMSHLVTYGQTAKPTSSAQLRQEMIRQLPALERTLDHLQGKLLLQEVIDHDKVKDLQQAGVLKDSKITGVGQQANQSWDVSFAISGENRKCDIRPSVGAGEVTIAQSGQSKEYQRRVFCMGPRGNFSLGWMTLDDKPEIKKFAAANTDLGPGYEEHAGVPLRAPISIFRKRLVDLLGDPNFKIGRIEPTTIDGHECSRVSFEWTMLPQEARGKPARKLAPLIGSFVTDPGLGYAIRTCEYHSQDKPGLSFTANIEYQTQVAAGEPPLPKRVEIIFGANHRTMTIEQLTRTTVPESEFTLSAYGLPEMDRPIGEVNRNILAYWLGGAALALIGLAGWLRHRSRVEVARP